MSAECTGVTVVAVREVTVHLVRHGQSTWNVAGRLQGQTAHPPLTDLGRRQAAQAADHLAALIGAEPRRLVSSDLVRARHTAEVIAARLAVECVEDDRLREQHLGTMQGKLTSELHPEPVPDDQHISEVRWGGGESIADVHQRLVDFFAATLPGTVGHLIMVTHGDSLRVAQAVLAGRGHREVDWEPVIGNGATVTVLLGAERRLTS